MKSIKARNFIKGRIRMGSSSFSQVDVENCVLFAEREAEKRMREKAVDAFKSQCVYRDQRCKPDCEGCGILKQFIQKLNEE